MLKNFDSEWLRRYPNPYAEDFRQAISKALGVKSDWIIVGNGSDELLNVVMRACIEPGRKVVYPTPTYVLLSDFDTDAVCGNCGDCLHRGLRITS